MHAVGSTIGMLMCGLLASKDVNGVIATTFQADGQTVSLAGSGGQFVNQLIAVVVTMALSSIASLAILKVIGATVGLRVTKDQEDLGLDLSEHNEKAYND